MIRLLIADDHPIVREGLKRIIAECKDMCVVSEAVDGKEVLEQCGKYDVDVLLLDITMPGPGFLTTLNRIKVKKPNLHVLVLSIHPENHYALRAIRAGASGYLTKNNTPDELENAIRHVYQGRKYLSAVLAEELVSELKGGQLENDLHKKLSNREYQILCLLGSGKKNSDIANQLALSPKTVSSYRSRILAKMNLDSTGDLIRYAVEHHLELD